MNTRKTGTGSSGTIALNRKARHDFFIEDRFEAGLALQGWEVKSIRDGRLQLNDVPDRTYTYCGTGYGPACER